MAKRKYGEWSEDDMHRALSAYRNGDMGFNECCRQYSIPKPTFNRHLKGLNVSANGEARVIGKQCTLPQEVEEALVNRILLFESLMFGLTITDVRKLAFDIAEKNHIPHNFNKETKLAGKKWFYAFKARHPQISLREPQATSMQRVKGFNKQNVYEFFDILGKLVDDNQIDATRIYNVDETGLSTVQNKCQKVLGRKGKKQIGSVSSGERGVNTTFVACASASGNYVPPMLIFKRMRMSDELKVGAPPGSLVEISESGYITSVLFLKWLQHFIDVVKPTSEKKVVLVLDGHTTHSKNLEAIDLARNHGVIMLQLPGHTTHRVQPLDRTFFKPLKSNFNQAIQKWLRTNPGLCVTQFQIAQLSAEAYGKAATIENAINGFRVSGVWPADRTVFQDHEFMAAENLNQVTAETVNNNEDPVDNQLEISWPDIPNPDHSANEIPKSNSISHISDVRKKLFVSVEALSPIPKPNPKSKKIGGIQKATILTSSPYKTQLELAKELQLTQEKLKELKAKMGKSKPKLSVKKEKKSPKKNKKNVKTSVGSHGNPSSASSNNTALLNIASSSKVPNVVIEVESQEWYCFLCEANRVEDMIRCQNCKLWVHESCAGVKNGPQTFVCVSCK